MLSTRKFDNHPGVAKRLSKNSLVNLDRGLVSALAGGLLLGATALAPTQAFAGPPVTIDVTVTGGGGAPVPGASVTVTEASPFPADPTAVSGGGTTGANGTTSVSNGATPGAQTSAPLPAGVYQVDVVANGVHTTTYVHVPEGQTGTTNIDLSSASTIALRGASDTAAAEAANAAKQAGDRAAYDAAVARLDEIIELREQANEDLESAIGEYAEANDIRATTLEEATKMRKRIKRLQDKRPDLVDPAQVAKLNEYIGLLNLLELWRNVLKTTETARDDIPSFSYLRSTGLDEGSEYAAADGALNRSSDLNAVSFVQYDLKTMEQLLGVLEYGTNAINESNGIRVYGREDADELLQAFADVEENGSDLAYQQDKENLQAAVHYFEEVDNFRLAVDGVRLRLAYRYRDQDWAEDDDDALASEDSGPWLELDEEEFAADDRPWRQPEVPGATIHQPTYRVQLNFHHF